MTDEPLLRKLQVKNGRSLRLIAAPADYIERISPLPEPSSLLHEGGADVVQVFVRNTADVAVQAQQASLAATGGVLWMTYPKGGSKEDVDLTSDVGWDALIRLGWRPVTHISIDETWSAVRFHLEEEPAPRAR